MLVLETILEFFEDDVIRYKPNIEGQSVEDNVFIIGDKAGPSRDLENLLHEMSHFAEREIEKLKAVPADAWGFSFGKYWQIGAAWGYEPYTDQSVQREKRVWAYQMSIMRHLEILTDPYEVVRSVKYLSAWSYYQPFAQKTHEDECRIHKLADEADKLSRETFTFGRFYEECRERINILKHRE